MTTAARVGRIGGLAVALGVGAAVATGLAASASAAPADTAERSAASPSRADARAAREARSTAADRGARTSVPARRGSDAAAASAAARSGSATVAPVRAAAAVSVPPVLSPAVAPAAAAPVVAVRQNPRRAPAGAAVQATAAAVDQAAAPARATAANPIAGLVNAFQQLFCDPRGRQIIIYKRTHFAIPNSFGFFVQKVSGTGTFTIDTTYDLGDEDQYDWNKFTGIAFTPLEPDRDSVMVGWRYNLVSREFEIAPFYNVDKVRILPKPQDIISVPMDQTFQYLVDYSGVTLTYGDKTVFKAFPEGLVPNVWTAARVSGWFGGNEAAPRTIAYFLKID